MIEEFGLYWGTTRWSQHRMFWHPFPQPPVEVSGLLGVLAGRGDFNYFHFLVEILPRLAILETEGVPTPERWYVPLGQSFQREILELAGFLPQDGIVDADAVPHVQAERLLVPGLPDAFKRTPPWSVMFTRDRLRPPDVELVPGRRIYVTRGKQRHNRIVTNESEVVGTLAGLGFEVVDPGAHSVAEQIRMFAEAECIVSPHGAALTNILFASAGASVIEILAPDYVDVGFWKLAAAIPGLNYRYLLGRGRRPRPGREEVGVMSDITVDLGALERALDSVALDLHPSAAKLQRWM
jgi:capsular polysaccharide biosynthesis protein